MKPSAKAEGFFFCRYDVIIRPQKSRKQTVEPFLPSCAGLIRISQYSVPNKDTHNKKAIRPDSLFIMGFTLRIEGRTKSALRKIK